MEDLKIRVWNSRVFTPFFKSNLTLEDLWLQEWGNSMSDFLQKIFLTQNISCWFLTEHFLNIGEKSSDSNRQKSDYKNWCPKSKIAWNVIISDFNFYWMKKFEIINLWFNYFITKKISYQKVKNKNFYFISNFKASILNFFRSQL